MMARTPTKRSPKKAPAKPRQKRNDRPASPRQMTLALTTLRRDGDTQPRAKIDENVVNDYAEAYGKKEKLPPLTVFYDGTAYWLADGFHRVRGAKEVGRIKVQCEVYKGGQEDARWYSYSANQTHGLRRSNADKRKSVSSALKHPFGKKLSDRLIADHCGVSHNLVSSIRNELSSDDSCPAETVGTDGKVRRRKPSKQRKTKTPKSIPPIDDDIDANNGAEIRDDDQQDATSIVNGGNDDQNNANDGAEDLTNVTVDDALDNSSADTLTAPEDAIDETDDDIDRTNGIELEQVQDAYDQHVETLLEAAGEPVRKQFFAWLRTRIG
jgi:hypothetical protein